MQSNAGKRMTAARFCMMCTVFGWKRHDKPEALTGPCYPRVDSSINNVIRITNEANTVLMLILPFSLGPEDGS